MLKVTVAVLAVVLAGTASAAGWRNLRIDASSEDSFKTSVDLFQEKLSPSRRHAFERALQEVWLTGTTKASAEQRDYTREDYFAQLNRLGYDEVVRLPDPTGERAQRYRAEYYASRGHGGQPFHWGTPPSPAPVQNGAYRVPTMNGGIRMETNAGWQFR